MLKKINWLKFFGIGCAVALGFTISGFTCALAANNRPATEFPGEGGSRQPDTVALKVEEASNALIRRILPERWRSFVAEYLPKTGRADVFEIESRGNKIVLRGNTTVSIASGLKFYLNNIANCQITWNGTNLHLPARLPALRNKIRRETSYDYRYYLNYCTFSYSMCWWDWERWEKEIDWMAMHGINFPLALTGQNAVWNRVYKKLGFTDKELSSFFSGPAHFGWFWMGNLDGVGGPLSERFMLKQQALQKKILERERSLGMTPILPAFTGHVPAAFKSRFPDAKLKDIEWGRQYNTHLLDPSDPLFLKIGALFMEDQIGTYGTDHYYSADTFNENTPPTSDSLFLNDISKTVYRSMASVDTEAVWVMQGWLFVNNPGFWQPSQIQALLNAVPDHKLIVLDLWSETRPVWSRTDSYYGKPWIWCMLQNFGGNVGMFGRMDTIAVVPARTLNTKAAGNLVGLGLTPEGIEQNPVMFELMMDNVWRKDPINLDNWLHDYVSSRYGKLPTGALNAWQVLRRTVYNGAGSQGAPESIITGRPTFNKEPRWTRTELYYDPRDLLPAWKMLINCSAELKKSDGFQYDIVDLTRNVLANYATQLRQEMIRDYAAKDREAFVRKSKIFLRIFDDLDVLLGTRKDFLLGRWVNQARRQGGDEEEKTRFEREAKMQITLWSGRDALLHDYACKQWAGMMKSFYKPRWERFFEYAIQCLDKGEAFNEDWFYEQMKDLELAWVNRHEEFTETPSGNPVEKAKKLYKKYSFLLE